MVCVSLRGLGAGPLCCIELPKVLYPRPQEIEVTSVIPAVVSVGTVYSTGYHVRELNEAVAARIYES